MTTTTTTTTTTRARFSRTFAVAEAHPSALAQFAEEPLLGFVVGASRAHPASTLHVRILWSEPPDGGWIFWKRRVTGCLQNQDQGQVVFVSTQFQAQATSHHLPIFEFCYFPTLASGSTIPNFSDLLAFHPT